MPRSLRPEPGEGGAGEISPAGGLTHFWGVVVVVLMAPRNELNAGGPCFCHLAVPICLDLENKTSPRTFLGSSTPSPSQLQVGERSPGEAWRAGRGGRQRDSEGKGAPQKP